ncbi:GspE/PulE family protein [Shewanella morhuae]|uniref:Type II traffic warden ATPase n=1 Tax=Shewanella morhuae TaxID=365591 RepID=A0A380A6Z5_9GAMM|nr:ATPase, T2SS/T4P/T4SS family [Shewanella morhuae]SUI75447.1 Type II traffic warden ATPase [Shewanella morhuae]
MISLIELLLIEFQISQKDLDKAISYQGKYGGYLEQILVNLGSLPEDNLPELYSKYFSLPIVELSDWIETELPTIETEDLELLKSISWSPISIKNLNWTFVVKYPLELKANEFIGRKGINATILIGRESDIQALNSRFSDSQSGDVDEAFIGDEEERLRELASEAPIVNLLNSLISRGLRQGASDMHLEPYQGRYRVRYRIDGVLQEVERLAPRMQLPIVTRLKILSGMDIAERRRPQDGKIAMKIANQELDIRVSALPLNEGESVVMRFLRKESVTYDMEVLGLADDVQQYINEDLTKTAGVILLTGPTGSGKTTTLYTFLNELNTDDVKIITLEDPVEYQLDGINQVQVNSDIGFDFSAGLRSIVRQDPDIIMLGEIRDKETARIAMQSALTGHLVFSTVHTNDAASAYTRLLDLGVDEFLLNAALVSILAQRLARRICKHCVQADPDTANLTLKYDLKALAIKFNIAHINLVKGIGCEVCGHTGYKGRIAVNEYLRCDEVIMKMPKDADFIAKARDHNRECGRRNLLEDGFYKAMLGQTTVEEVLRVAG